ncbi:MAG: phage tail tape measure protein, partial [Dehalococcoidia bacterium]|nr:phage tail tape measure protein [Dehalococcoidia bacterium]
MPDVRYIFTASGHDSVIGAFRGIRAAAREAGMQSEAAFGQMARGAARAQAAVNRVRPPLRGGGRAGLDVRADRDAVRIMRGIHRDAVAAQRQRTRDEAREINKRMALARREAAARGRVSARRAAAVGQFLGITPRDIGHMIGGTLKNALMAAVAVAGVATRDAVQLEDFTTRLALKGTPLGGTVDPERLRKKFQRIASEVPGARAEDIAAGADVFVARTGRLDIVEPVAKLMAEIGVATGTEIKDIGGAFAELFQKFDIKTVEDFAKAANTLTVQGKRGAFELPDMARQLTRVGQAARAFDIEKGPAGAALLGGLLQIARKGASGPAAASTNLQNLLRDVGKRADLLKSTRGVDLFTGEGAD